MLAEPGTGMVTVPESLLRLTCPAHSAGEDADGHCASR